MNENTTGFIVCDISAGPDAKKFEEIDWPPIFFQSEIEFQMLPEWMQTQGRKKNF